MTSPGSSASSTPTGPARASFREDLVTTPELPTHRALASAMADVQLAEIVASVRAGTLKPTQMVEAIVERALTSPVVAPLSPEARERLGEMLRERFVDDPALAALVEDLERAAGKAP